MIFDVLKVTESFSKHGTRKGTHSLKFEVVPEAGAQLDFGNDQVLITSGYHRFRATDRKIVEATIFVTSDAELADERVGTDACGSAYFSPDRGELSVNVVVEPKIFEAMTRAQISKPGTASLWVTIEDLEFGNAPDGSHQIWELKGKKADWVTRKAVSDFWLSTSGFWTNQQDIWEAKNRQTKAWLVDHPDPEQRAVAKPEPDPLATLLRHCRMLLAILVILGALAVLRFSR